MITLAQIQANEARKIAEATEQATQAAEFTTLMTAREAAGKLAPSSWGA